VREIRAHISEYSRFMIFFYALIFIISCFLLVLSGKWLVNSLTRIAKFLGWKEFVVAFFIIALGSSLSSLFVGILSALKKVPQLSLGDVIGANIFDLTIAVALAAFISKQGLSAPSRTVQGSSIFTVLAALLPLILISDGNLSRPDGFLLILTFIFYIFWLFQKEERFKKVYDEVEEIKGWKYFLKDLGLSILSIVFLILGAKGIVESSSFFAKTLNLPLIFIGIFIVGIGDALPETFFSIGAARHGQDWMILGNLMGSVMITATLVLGTVALVCPIQFFDFSILAAGRIFLVISAIFFLIFLRTGRKITRREAVILFSIYILFLISQIFFLAR
jgi:cation:H+ antiporter